MRRYSTLTSLIVMAAVLIGARGPVRAWAGPGTQPAKTDRISVEDVIRLVKAGLSEDIIIQQIRRKGAPAELSADQLIHLKNASVGDRIIRAMLETPARPEAGASSSAAPAAKRPPAPSAAGPRQRQPAASALIASPAAKRLQPSPSVPEASPKATVVAAKGTAPPAATGEWSNHTNPMGFALTHPAAWKVSTDDKLGRVTVVGDRGERLIIWPMFLERRQLDARHAGVLVGQLAAKIDAQMPWGQPKAVGRYMITTAHDARRKSTAILAFANSQNGSSILFYSVAAPSEAYAAAAPVFSRMLGSFQIVNPPTGGGTPGKRAPVGAVQYVRWTDPLENAFSLSVPQGWKVIGGMYRFAATDSRAEMVVVSPQGGILIKLGLKEFGRFMEPMPGVPGMKSGALSQHDGSRLQIMPYLSGQQFARYYVERVRLECAGVRVISSNNHPELAGNISREAQADQLPAGQVTAGDVTFTCNAQGVELRGYFIAATMRIGNNASNRGMGGAMWFVYKLGGYLTAPEWQQDAERIALDVIHSIQANPSWRARERQMSSEISAHDTAASIELQHRAFAAIAENQRQTSDLISSSYWAQQARYDEISRKRENGILGTVDTINPTTGESVKLQYNSNYYWMNDAGYMAGALTHDAPGVGWQEMLQFP